MLFRPDTVVLSAEVIEACKRFRQGSILENVRVAYSASAVNGLTEQARQAVAGGAAPVDGGLGVGITLERAMIVTQNCDLLNEDRMVEIPLVSVVPVFDAIAVHGDTPVIRNALKNRATHLYYVRLIKPDVATPEGENPVWVADLRTEFLIERSLLVGRDPIAGFCDGKAYVTCARRVAAYRGRAAIDDDVRADIVEPFVAGIKKLGLKNEIAELWVECKPDPLDVTTTMIHVVLKDAKDVDRVNEALGVWYKEFLKEYFATHTESEKDHGPLSPRVHTPGPFDADNAYPTAQQMDWPPA